MKLFRNREVRFIIPLQLAVCAICGFAVSYITESVAAGLLTALAGCICAALSLLSTVVRYRKISALSGDIDKLLHGLKNIDFSDYSEGELSILQNELQKMTVKLLEQASALENDKTLLTDSIADISHQLRTPLTSVNMQLAMLDNDSISNEERHKRCKSIEVQLGRIDWLITALLKLSRLESGTASFRHEKVELQKVLELALEPLAVPMELRGQRVVIVGDGTEYLMGDILWTAEALENILKNCMEYAGEGGLIRVECSQNPLFSQILIYDNGCGIDTDDLPHLFERFYRGKNTSSSGFGIGLALSRRIIAEQNGTIKAENLRSKGALFTIKFYTETPV